MSGSALDRDLRVVQLLVGPDAAANERLSRGVRAALDMIRVGEAIGLRVNPRALFVRLLDDAVPGWRPLVPEGWPPCGGNLARAGERPVGSRA